MKKTEGQKSRDTVPLTTYTCVSKIVIQSILASLYRNQHKLKYMNIFKWFKGTVSRDFFLHKRRT